MPGFLLLAFLPLFAFSTPAKAETLHLATIESDHYFYSGDDLPHDAEIWIFATEKGIDLQSGLMALELNIYWYKKALGARYYRTSQLSQGAKLPVTVELFLCLDDDYLDCSGDSSGSISISTNDRYGISGTIFKSRFYASLSQ